MAAYPLTTLAIIIAIFVFFGFGIVVGKARAQWNVPAPASSGHPEFDKRNRVATNTLEQLVMFVPTICLAAPVLGDMITAGLGLVWSIGRIVYARAYYQDPAKRGPGFGLTVLPTFVLAIAAIYGAVVTLIS